MISVIVPVYNTEKYLHRCVDSILAQTYTDFELLLINDGSTDSSGTICDEYAMRDSRVRVFHKENGGVSTARNLGLDNAQCEHITFVDSDDWLETKALEYLIEFNDTDLTIGTVQLEKSKTIQTLHKESVILKGKSLRKHLSSNFDNCIISGPWAKIFKKNIIEDNHLRFDKTLSFGEDNIFVKTYLQHIDNLKITNKLCYHYNDIDDTCIKYSTSFQPILIYYKQAISLYCKIEDKWHTRISKHGIVGVAFEIAYTCLRNNNQEINDILNFLRDKEARKELYKRDSLNIRIILFLSLLPNGICLTLYIKAMKYIKKLLYFIYDKKEVH